MNEEVRPKNGTKHFPSRQQDTTHHNSDSEGKFTSFSCIKEEFIQTISSKSSNFST
jgi:hypothetical protein